MHSVSYGDKRFFWLFFILIAAIVAGIYLQLQQQIMQTRLETALKQQLLQRYRFLVKLEPTKGLPGSITLQKQRSIYAGGMREFQKSLPLFSPAFESAPSDTAMRASFSTLESLDETLQKSLQESGYISRVDFEKATADFWGVAGERKQRYLHLYSDISGFGAYVRLRESLFGKLYLLLILATVAALSGVVASYGLQHRKEQLEQEFAQKELDMGKIAFEDELTKAASRMKLNETLKDLLRLSDRFEQCFSIVMFDIDDFKRINDTYGHDYGDRVLVAISDFVSGNVRHSDTFARWGGEEFVILSPYGTLEQTVKLAQKLKDGIAGMEWPGGPAQVTCSFGVAEFQKGDDQSSLLKRADEGLYMAKNSGKNRVEVRAKER